jgi:hypothetical protein
MIINSEHLPAGEIVSRHHKCYFSCWNKQLKAIKTRIIPPEPVRT